MNTARIAQAVRDIEMSTAALKWLEQYGPHLVGRDAVSIHVRPNYASSCPGADEAAAVLQSFAHHEIGRLVEVSIRNCRNTIELARSAIIEEAGRSALSEAEEGRQDG